MTQRQKAMCYDQLIRVLEFEVGATERAFNATRSHAAEKKLEGLMRLLLRATHIESAVLTAEPNGHS